MAYDDLGYNFGYGSNPSPSFFTPSNDAFDASKAWGPSTNWSPSTYDWSGKNTNNPDFTSMLKSQTFSEKPTAREGYNLATEVAKAIPKAISAFGGQPGSRRFEVGSRQGGYGSGSLDESELSSNNGTVRKAGDLIFVTPPQQQYVTTPGKRSLASTLLGVAAPIAGALTGPLGVVGAAAAGSALSGLSSIV
jgi:hypothetical protein